MSKYINAEHLRKEVKRLEKAAHKSALGCADRETRKFHEGKDYAYQHVGVIIDSLQSGLPNIDLEEEINRFWDSCIKHKNERGGNVIWSNKLEVEALAHHFYELGLNARKEK